MPITHPTHVKRTVRRRLHVAWTCLALIPLLSGCDATLPRRHAETAGSSAASCNSVGGVPLPQGADWSRMQRIEKGVRWAVYTRIRPVNLSQSEWRGLPRPLAQAFETQQLDVTLADAVKGSRRFVVYDGSYAETNTYSNVQVELTLMPVEQQLRKVGSGYLKLHTRVLASASVTDMRTGEDLLGSDLQVMGQYGHRTDGGVVVRQASELDAPDKMEARLSDLRAALYDAMEQVREQLESKLLPVAPVETVDGCRISLGAGSLHGLQSGDELVVFRPNFSERTGNRRLVGGQAVALLRCPGVNTQFSECRLVRLAPGMQPHMGDFAVLAPQSAIGVRQR